MPSAIPSAISRREVVRLLAGAATGVAAGCAPLRIALNVRPGRFDDESGPSDRVLRAFVQTVVPGADLTDPDLTRVFRDPFFPLARYRAVFASDLCRRAGDLAGCEAFERLTGEERTRVIQHGLEADPVTRKLYTGAVFLTQVALYGGIYHDQNGSPLLGFDGPNQVMGPVAAAHPEPRRFLGEPATSNGNFN